MTPPRYVKEKEVRRFVLRFAARAGGRMESIVLSPYPFGGSQLLVVCREEVPYVHEMATESHLCDPPDILTHWLRPSELGELSLPFYGLASWFRWKSTGGYPGWSYWLRGRGELLWGRDIRAEVPLPQDPRSLLGGALLGCITWTRALLPLPFLIREQYASIVEILAGQARRLAATALLLRGVWEIEEATVLDRFGEAYAGDGATELCVKLHALSSARADRRLACEALWLSERLIRLLRRYAE